MTLLGLCIVFAIGFTVVFNVISRLSLSTTKHEMRILFCGNCFAGCWPPCSCRLIPFHRAYPACAAVVRGFVAFRALADAFLFSAFKFEEASVLSAIFPLNFVFTFVVSMVFFEAWIKLIIVFGFIIIMLASFFLIGFYKTNFRPSKGVVFASCL